jgi:pilus assembly protein Flp/PilA
MKRIKDKKTGRSINMMTMINLILQNKKGQGMVEYGLILALVAVVGMAGLALLGPEVLSQFEAITNALKPAAAQ